MDGYRMMKFEEFVEKLNKEINVAEYKGRSWVVISTTGYDKNTLEQYLDAYFLDYSLFPELETAIIRWEKNHAH